MKNLIPVIAFFALGVSALAQKPHASHPFQDPITTLPKYFKLEFENDWVKVTRTHYDAHGKLPEHDHPQGVSLYMYLNASDGVLFSHLDGSDVPRPPVQAGGIRIANTPAETHTVVNSAATDSDFLRVFLKTELNPRLSSPTARMSPAVAEYDHTMLRVSRIAVAPHSKAMVEARNNPIFRIAWVPGKTEWKLTAANPYRFLDKSTTEEFENTGDVPLQLVTIELKSKPVKPR